MLRDGHIVEPNYRDILRYATTERPKCANCRDRDHVGGSDNPVNLWFAADCANQFIEAVFVNKDGLYGSPA